MNDRLRKYINNLFEEAPQTRKTVELKEEILQNITDKYYDLLSEGKTEEAAYNIAIASVGEVNELIDSLKINSEVKVNPSYKELDEVRKRSAKTIAIAVSLYILSLLPLVVFDGHAVGFVMMLAMIAIATAMIIYNNISKPRYMKIDDTIVEEFKEWKENRGNKGLNSLISAIWSLTTAIYFIVSFITGAWYITWVIFLIATAINSVIKAVFDLKGEKR